MGLKTVFKTVYQYGNDVNIEYLSGKSIAIDMMTYIVKFFKIAKKNNTNWMKELIQFLTMFKTNNIHITCVYDGYNKPFEKKYIIRERRKKVISFLSKKKELEKFPCRNERKIENLDYVCSFPTHDQVDESKVVVAGLLRIPVLVADGDGEILCCTLQKKKEVDYVLSEDSDVLFCGATNFLCYRGGATFKLYNTSYILFSLGITSEQFFYICLMIGSDYNVGLGYNSFNEAKDAMKEKGIEDIKEQISKTKTDIERIKVILSSERCEYFRFDQGKILELKNKYLVNV